MFGAALRLPHHRPAANTGDTFLGQDSLHDVADDNLIVNYKDDNLLAGRGHGKNE